MPPVVEGVVERAQHLAVERVGVEFFEVLGHRLAGHRQRVAVQQPLVEQRLHEHGKPAVAVDVVHDVVAERLDVGDVRHLARCG
jgi:hypothetical protein